MRPLIVLLTLIGLAAFLSLFTTPQPLSSVELGIAEGSPAGYVGGQVVPASCPSYAHFPGECDTPPPPPPEACVPSLANNNCGTGPGGGTTGGTPGGTPDACNNIAGAQATVPSGYTAQAGACIADNCENNPYGVACDRCPNIADVQTATPDGYMMYQGRCVPIETCSLIPSNTEINVGGSSVLSWSCSQSSSATGVGFSTGGAPNSSVEVSPEETTTYGIQCHAGCYASARVKVNDPTLAISANPLRVRQGNSSTLFWGADQVTSCVVRGPNFEATGISGSKSTGPINGQSTYTLTCQTVKGPRSTSVTVGLIPSQVEI